MGSRKDKKGRVLHTGESQREKYYIYQYTDVTGKRRVIYAKDLPELRLKEKEIKRALDDGMDTYKMATLTLNDAFDIYFAQRTDLKYASRLSYKYLYNHHVRQQLGTRKLAKIRYSDVKEFYFSLAQSENISYQTIAVLHSVLSQVFKEKVRDNVIRNNPTEGAWIEFSRRNGLKTTKRHPLTVEQQRNFLSFVQNHPLYERWSPLFIVLLGTGCRIGEALGLRWEDIDFDKKCISITHSLRHLTLDTGKVGFYISTPKTEAGNRVIPMMKQVEQAFLKEKQNQILRNSGNRYYKPPQVDGYTDFVFTDFRRKGGLLHSDFVNKVLKQIIEDYNGQEETKSVAEGRPPAFLPYITCHHFRHTFCTRFCENETNLKVIQEVMGHSDISITMNKYVEATEEVKQASIKNLENKILI